MYGALLIGVLAAAGGLIAFLGDWLGTKIGKKRLSIFGLRPRHTSMVITVLTGVAITTLTFGVMAAVSENVRTALFGMEQLNKNMKKTQDELQRVSKELLAAEDERQKAAIALVHAKKDVADLQKEQEDLKAESEQLAEGNRRLAEEKETLTAQNEELFALNEDLAARNDGLLAQNSALAEQNNALTAQNGALAADNGTLAAANDTLSRDNAALADRAQKLREGLVAVREGSIVYRAGEVIAAGVIKGNRPESEIAEDLTDLINTANNDVKQREGDLGEIWINSAEYEAIIGKIAAAPKNMLVRITAAGNLIKGEPVHTAVELYENDIIYRKNEFVIAKTFDVTDLTEDEAENLLLDFLRDANAAAGNRGVLRDPIRGSVGVMDGAQFYTLVDKLLPLSGTVKLTAFARDDTDAAGPMRLNIKIEAET